MESKKFISSNLTVGENPLYNHLDGNLYYVDIRGKCFYCADCDGKVLKKVDLSEQIGCMAICSDGDFLLGMETGVYLLDKNGQIKLAHAPQKILGRRFNDGKVGADGAYYLGTTDAESKGAFYRLKNGQLTKLLDGVNCSNGLDWSLDGTKMYYVDSPLKKVEVFDFDINATNPLSNRRTCCDLKDVIPENAVPDGMCIDEQGYLWVAIWNGGKVLKIDAEKSLVVDQIDVEVNKPSSCAFVGENLDKLLITSANFLEQDKNAGSLYIANVNTKGFKVNLYKKGE